MAFRSIDNITISDGRSKATAGFAFDGLIYSFSFQLGFSEGPSKLSVNIINNEGIYPDLAGNLSFLSPYDIKIGTTSFKMYLIKTATNKSAQQKVLTVQFIDGSHILDRIYVGLIGTHVTSGTYVAPYEVEYEIPVACPKCDGTTGVEIKESKVKRKIDAATGNQHANNREGGFIFLGVEDFKQTDCDLGDVTYNFSDLKAACSSINIEIDIPDKASVIRAGQPQADGSVIKTDYRKAYTGTLREVLNNWCADFGYTFTWDYTFVPGKVFGIDIGANSTLPATIKSIKQQAENLKDPKAGALVRSIETSTSLEGTYRQFAMTHHKRRAVPQTFKRVTHFRTWIKTLQPWDIYNDGWGVDANGDPEYKKENNELQQRTMSRFLQSMALGKYHQTARKLFNKYYNYMEALGYDSWLKITDGMTLWNNKKKIYQRYDQAKFLICGAQQKPSDKGSLGVDFLKKIIQKWTGWKLDEMNEFYNSATGKSSWEPWCARTSHRSFIGPPPPNASTIYDLFVNPWIDIYFVSKDPKKAQELQSWEQAVANQFLGKNFYTKLSTKDREFCPQGNMFKDIIKTQLSPPLQYVYVGDKNDPLKRNSDTPWRELIRGVPPTNLFTANYGGVQADLPFFSHFAKGGAKWGNMNEDWRLFTTNKENDNDLLSHFEPVEVTINGDQQKKFKERFGFPLFDFLSRHDGDPAETGVYDTEQGTVKEAKMVIYPSNFFIQNYILQWSDLGDNYINSSEPTYFQKTPPDTSRKCELLCDKQRNEMLADTCDCRDWCDTHPNDPQCQAQQVSFGSVTDPRSEKEGPHTTGVYTQNTLGMSVSLPAVQRGFFGLGHYKLKSGQAATDAGCTYLKDYHKIKNKLGFPSFNIVFPQGCREDEGWYAVNYTEAVDRTYVLNSMRTTLVDLGFVGENSEIKVAFNDVSQSIDQFAQASGPAVINIYVPGVGFTTMQDHHNFLKNLLNNGSEYPRVAVNLVFGSLDTGSIAQYLSPQFGMVQYNAALGEDGITVTVGFANKPLKLPTSDTLMAKIGPQIKNYTSY